MKQISDIAIVVPTRNEEKILPTCLEALRQFANVYVVDSNSTDRTNEIASESGATVINFSWDGKFPKKRNWFLDNFDVDANWVMFVDADEILTKEFVKEVMIAIQNPKYDSFWVSYENYFQGERMRFGIQQRKLALFKTHLRYEQLELQVASKYDMEIHEHPISYQKSGYVKSKVKHFDDRGLINFVNKHLAYASWEVERYSLLVNTKNLSFRQKVKYKLLGYWFFPFLYFLLDYFVYLRFVDGRAGFSYSFYKSFYFKIILDLLKKKEFTNQKVEKRDFF